MAILGCLFLLFFLKNPGEMEYFMGWLIIVEKKYKLHVISEFR